MAVTDKMVKLMTQLQKNTAEGKVSWQKTVDDGIFQVGFPNYTIKLFVRPNPNDFSGPDYVLQILGVEGEIIEEVSDTDFDSPEPSTREAYTLMKDLYTRARRIGMGVERALDSILSELSA